MMKNMHCVAFCRRLYACLPVVVLLLLPGLCSAEPNEGSHPIKKKIFQDLQRALQTKLPTRVRGNGIYTAVIRWPARSFQVDVVSPSCIVAFENSPSRLYVSAGQEAMFAVDPTSRKVEAEPVWIPGTLSPVDLYTLVHLGAPLVFVRDLTKVTMEQKGPNHVNITMQTTYEQGPWKSHHETLTLDTKRNKLIYASLQAVDQYNRSFLQFQINNEWTIPAARGTAYISHSKMTASFMKETQPQNRTVEITWEQPQLLSATEIKERTEICLLVQQEIERRKRIATAPIALAKTP